jgi:hypothetical protein
VRNKLVCSKRHGLSRIGLACYNTPPGRHKIIRHPT